MKSARLAAAVGWALCLTGCLGPAQDITPPPEAAAGALAGLDRAQLVERLNRALGQAGQDMLHATGGCLVESYWYIKWVSDFNRFPELSHKALPWGEMTSFSLRCRTDTDCDLRINGQLASEHVEALGLTAAQARQLARLAGRLGRMGGAPSCQVPDRDATLRYELAL